MRRAQRPLDSDAVSAADEQIYNAHVNDPRPNPLYDASGRRLKLSASASNQQRLREEWWLYYFEALDAKKAGALGIPAPPPPAPPPVPSVRDERPAGQPNQPCSHDHWIVAAVTPEDWPARRPEYWPAAPSAGLYCREPFAAQITDGSHTGTLDASGGFAYYAIPAGTCSFRLPDCLKTVEASLQDKAKYVSQYPQGDW